MGTYYIGVLQYCSHREPAGRLYSTKNKQSYVSTPEGTPYISYIGMCRCKL